MDENTTLAVVETDEEKRDASRAANSEASVAFATTQSTTEYTTERVDCQVNATPTVAELEQAIASAARMRIEAARRELQDTRGRIERERTARELALKAVQERVNQAEAALDGLAGERGAMESRARAFLGGDELQAMLGKIHLAFNARQLELEDELAVARTDAAEAQADVEAASVSDALELQLAEQEVERLESAAPEVAEQVQLVESAGEKLALAAEAVGDGLLRDAAVLLDQARAGMADSAEIANVERALAEAQKDLGARDLIARLNANVDQPGAVRRIRALMNAPEFATLTERVQAHADRALRMARDAANARFAQARPIADHLASEGLIPVVGDGRIEAWKQVSRNAAVRSDNGTAAPHGGVWTLDHLLVLHTDGEWVTERPGNPITSKELPARVRHSRWFRAAVSPNS